MIRVIKLSNVAKDYIERYYQIFETMKSKMEGVENTDIIAQNFINTMIPHHEAAIEMSKNILNYTTDVDIETLAKAIIEDQTRHITEFEQLKDVCTQPDSERDLMLYNKGYMDAYNKMIGGMANAQTGNNLNIDFLTEMIPHHEGAINMSRNLLKFNVCEQLREKCEELVMTQQTQLDQMKGLLHSYMSR